MFIWKEKRKWLFYAGVHNPTFLKEALAYEKWFIVFFNIIIALYQYIFNKLFIRSKIIKNIINITIDHKAIKYYYLVNIIWERKKYEEHEKNIDFIILCGNGNMYDRMP